MIQGDVVISLFRNSRKVKYIWCLLLLFAAALNGASQDISIYDSIAEIKENNNNPDQVAGHISLSDLHFAKARNNHINFGRTASEYHYVVLKLNSTHTRSGQCLSIDNTSLDTVSIYRIHNEGTGQLLYQEGELIPYKKNRNYVWHTVDLEISEQPSFYLIALKASQENINVLYDILDKDELQKKYQAYERFVFFYTGIVCMIMAIILLAFFLFKKTVFAAFLGYMICIAGWILSHYGRIFPFVYPHKPVINEIAKPLSTLGACFFLITVLHHVFKQQLQSHKWHQQFIKWMRYILLLLTICMLLLLIPKLSSPIKANLIAAWHAGLILSFCLVVFTPLRFFGSGATAKIFSYAVLVIGIMTIVQEISNFGYINNFFIKEHGITIANLIENFIMAFGLFYNFLEETRQKERKVLALEQEHSDTLKKLITLEDNERKRIANDLHDNIGPLLAALKINFRRIIHAKEGSLQNELVSKTESIIDDSINEIRNVAHNLMPKGLSANGLINTLAGYFESLQQLYNKSIIFHHQIQSIFHPDLQINLYRIICELVLNAARHSNGRLITVGITTNEKRVSIAIGDDGQGFVTKSGDQKKSLGLQSAESRVLYLKGKFSLKAKPGKGTFIDMEIPLQFYEPQVDSL